MDEVELKAGFESLNSLALVEYREPLEVLTSDADPQRAAVRLGRLVGVLLKSVRNK